MNLQELLNNKSLKPKEKTETISHWLLDNSLKLDELIEFAKTAKDPVKATCIEAIEFATKNKAETGTLSCLEFVTQSLTNKAPRVKWESAKVIGDIAHLFPDNLDEAITNLLINSEHSGAVVRWSAAFALGEILKLKSAKNNDLLPAIESVYKSEEKNSIKKIYADALKKSRK